MDGANDGTASLCNVLYSSHHDRCSSRIKTTRRLVKEKQTWTARTRESISKYLSSFLFPSLSFSLGFATSSTPMVNLLSCSVERPPFSFVPTTWSAIDPRSKMSITCGEEEGKRGRREKRERKRKREMSDNFPQKNLFPLDLLLPARRMQASRGLRQRRAIEAWR